MLENHSPNENDRRVEMLVQLIWNDQRFQIPTGEYTHAEDYIAQFPELTANSEAAVDVIYHELVIRNENSGPIAEAEYFDRFPSYVEPLKRQIFLARRIEAQASSESRQIDEQVEFSDAGSDSDSGREIGGYQLGSELGRGSFAIVYEAWDPRLNRKLAIKLPRADLLESANVKKRMLREARSAAQLFHPGIVAVHEIRESDGVPFIVTDFVDGITLEDQLNQKTPSQEISASWVATIAEAVHYAHQNGIIHRDIKPANILVRKDGHLLLTDFGLAQLADSGGSITRHGDILGTPSYMSPEQAAGSDEIDLRTDVYSLGVLLFRCLTGELPFDGPISTILYRVINQPADSLRNRTATLPRDLETITIKCLQKNPVDRYQTARELADDLNRFLRDEPISARSVGTVEKLVRQIRKRPWMSSLVAATVVLLGFVAGGALLLADVMRQRDRATTAELQAQSLIASSNFDAGLLAKQQGDLREAIRHFTLCVESGYEDPGGAQLQLAECCVALGKIEQARKHLDDVADGNSSTDRDAQIEYWNCELALLDGSSVDSVLQQIDNVTLGELRSDQQQFLLGMRSDRSIEALDHFRSAIELNRHHHSARRSSLIIALSLAHFDEVLRESEVSQRIYPEDDDFRLLESLALAAKGDSISADAVVAQTQLDRSEKEAWVRFCKRIEFVTTKMTNEDRSEQINFSVVKTLGTQFQTEFYPLIKERRWHFPPRIASIFVGLPSFSISASEQDHESIIANAISIAHSHPEASLLTLAGRTCIDKHPRPEIKDLEAGRDLFQKALDYPGFLQDAQQHARLGILATSSQLAMIDKHDVESNTTFFVQAVSELDPETIDKYSRLRTITLVLINAKQWELAEVWSQRWANLPGQAKSEHTSSLWHYGIVLENQERWLELFQVCNRILEIDPQMEVAEDFRSAAAAKLQKILGGDQ